MDGKAHCAICHLTHHQSCQTAPLMVIAPPRVSRLHWGVHILWENVLRGEETAAELIKTVITKSSPPLLKREREAGRRTEKASGDGGKWGQAVQQKLRGWFTFSESDHRFSLSLGCDLHFSNCVIWNSPWVGCRPLWHSVCVHYIRNHVQ